MESLLPERQFSQKWHIKGLLTVVLVILILFGSGQMTGVSTDFSWDQFWQILIKMTQPDWSYVSAIVTPILETIQMALVC